jgi:DNA-binding transcriptional LysR family regulator
MREVNLSGVDLNLLPALDALLRRRHVTKAAEEVGLSQPAMSRALARLRELLADPLLVRGRTGLVLTPHAESMAPRLAVMLSGARGLFQPRAFEPGTLQRTMRIAGSDVHALTLVPGMLRLLRAEAPGVDLVIVPYAQDLAHRLEDGSLDFAFGLEGSPLPPGAVSFPVNRDTLALVMRRKHPAAKSEVKFEDYARFDHASVSIFGDGRSEIDARLAQAGLSRRIALTTPHFMAALAAVAASDLVTTISRRFAQRFAKTFDVILRDPPFDAPVMVNTLVTAAARAQDPALLWFCGLVREAGQSSTDIRL